VAALTLSDNCPEPDVGDRLNGAELGSDERWWDVSSMTEPLRLTIVYEDAAGDGWVTARVAEVPGAISEGATRAQAKENVIDALRGILELRFGEHALSEPIEDSESLELVIAA
jgi:predicted RNase H-like HicB family nuclease